ncbi:hypothetical protein [Nocardia bovistercoris]|uniref:Uncharacterized protein n=1 Tax=Nocardia bovistercoris TaxID=2785916 RepID=A0A931IDV2_9NOCA|nr:hypothetical protein [Nocardia bovistercoris]MBH0779609.1 hypothetical protein [Nocardia bovistercoris]
MTTYFLDRGGRMTLPGNKFHLRVDGAGGRVAIDVTHRDHQGLSSGRRDRATVSRITQRTIIAAVPGDGAPVFRDGARVALFIESDDEHGSEPLTVEVVQQDVGATFRAELARLTPVGNRIELSVRAPDQLSPRALAAFRTAHELLGARTRPHAVADEIDIAIDTTASMAARLTDGSIPALADLIAGVSRAAGCDLRDVRLLGPLADSIAAEPLGTLADRVAAVVGETGVGIGRSTGVAESGNGDDVVLVVTDAPPVERLDTGPGVRHLVLSEEPIAADAPAQTGIVPAHLTATAVTAPTVPDQDAATLRHLVRGLLAALAARA